jgi:arylamine N-acetyltransferase
MPLRSKKIRQLGERVVVEMDIPDDWQPGRIHRVLAAVRREDYEYIVEMESGEFVQVGPHRLAYQMPEREPRIPEDEFKRRCLAVQATWSPEEREKRWCGPKRTYVEIQVVKSNGLAKGAPDYEF